MQHVLVQLSVAGPTEYAFVKFKKNLMGLPPGFKVEVVDTYESHSVGFILRMSWSTYARLSSVIDLKLIMPLSGPHLFILVSDGNTRPSSAERKPLR